MSSKTSVHTSFHTGTRRASGCRLLSAFLSYVRTPSSCEHDGIAKAATRMHVSKHVRGLFFSQLIIPSCLLAACSYYSTAGQSGTVLLVFVGALAGARFILCLAELLCLRPACIHGQIL